MTEIGFIGLGKMGKHMAEQLMQAGHTLTVYDIVPEASAHLSAKGATVYGSCRAVAQRTDILISSIPDDRALEAVVFGDAGVLKGAGAKTIFIDMSTVSPRLSARVGEAAAAQEVAYLRAPVSGSTESAVAGSLTIMVSGPKAAYERCSDILKVLGQKIFHVGPGEEARYLKLLVNIMVGITSAITAEALVFGKCGGLEWEQMIDIINSSVVASPLIGFKKEMLKKRDFTPAFTVGQMSKDFDLALEAGRARNIPLPLTALTRQLYGILKATGRGEIDYFGLEALLEEMAGIDH